MSNDRTAKLFVVSGPSGSGKSTICREVVKRTDARLGVSATTRTKSDSETDGKDYYFLDEAQFEEKIRNGEFLEYARVFENYYGTPAEPVYRLLDAGETVILEIDVQGAEQVFEKCPDALGVFIEPPGDDELSRRLCERGRDDSETIQKRLAKATWETEKARASGKYAHTIVNDDLENAIGRMIKLIGDAKD